MLEGELLEYFIGKNNKWRIIKFLIKNPKSNTSAVAKALKMKLSNASYYLKELSEKGLAKYEMPRDCEKPSEKLWDTEVDEVVFSLIKKKRLDWYFLIIFYSIGLGFVCLVFQQNVAMMVSFINMALVLFLRLKEAKEIK